ncbi:MAG: indole-3-glycerol phosphate synthase [Methanomicrobiales archaeon HGW-Methanomicrobiales-3]|jgi:indole-3-glycerol phosphate synthase|nr:MAG: indole-3-glycerol phosphate synthase [Methanomicrobiales archaeon HGW-Methanomicrobiales-3]
MILDEILKKTKKRVAGLPPSFPETPLRDRLSLATAIRNRNGRNAIIAEIKCASPSSGVIRRNIDMAMMAGELREGGCVALSVLTEPYFFGGTGQDIERVKSMVQLPVLRKDFIIDKKQVAESVSLGADAVLLIAAVLKNDLSEFVDEVINYGLEPLVEVRTREEAELALASRTTLIGVNNRNLVTLGIDRSTTRLISEQIRQEGRLIVSESGMRSADDIREMKQYCDAFLIGSSIMTHNHPRKKLEEFVCA